VSVLTVASENLFCVLPANEAALALTYWTFVEALIKLYDIGFGPKNSPGHYH
jgi:hypothetical protein